MVMKKFINKPENITSELLEGLALVHDDVLEVQPNNLVVSKFLKDANRVTVVTFGGSGHEPALEGFVGDGMVDVAVCGDIFAAPGPQPVIDAIKLADKGHGVLLVVLNHAGDMLTGNLVMKECNKLGIKVAKIVTQEDIMTAPREDAGNRRGFVGCCPLYKIAGGAAKQGKTLEEVAEMAQYFADNMAAISITSRTCTHPANGAALGELADNMIGIGMGQHGEGGGYQIELCTADEVIAIAAEKLIEDLSLKAGEELMVVLDGIGAMTVMEQLICYRATAAYLESKGIKIVAKWVDEILTVQEAAGFQLFFARMTPEMVSYWDESCKTAYLKK
ncbi:MAG: dihydroxyacetone kinase subunit DhaK [Mycoplasmatota bacterium]